MAGSIVSNVATVSARPPRRSPRPRRPTPTRELLSEPTGPSRSRLSGAKLEALVRASSDAEPSGQTAFGEGAALKAGSRAWILVDGDAAGSLGPAMAWAWHHDATELTLIGIDGVGTAARRASLFDDPPTVLTLVGTALEPAAADPLLVEPPPPDDPALAAQLEAAGLEVNVEHGRLLGEYRGLEVARIEPGDHGAALHIGVGKLDREMTALVHEDLPRPEALDRVVGIVRKERQADRPPHPLRDLAPERWLRSVLVADPAMVACVDLAPAPSPFARENLTERSTTACTGHDESGRAVTLVVSVGVDLDLVPTAADTRAHLDPASMLVVVVPERDAHPLTQELAAGVRDGCEIRTVPTEWRS